MPVPEAPEQTEKKEGHAEFQSHSSPSMQDTLQSHGIPTLPFGYNVRSKQKTLQARPRDEDLGPFRYP